MPYDLIFNYCDTHDFHNHHDIIECLQRNEYFSAIHCNVRSLSANIENLTTMLSEFHYSFSVISLTLKLAGYFAKHIQARGGFVEPPQEF